MVAVKPTVEHTLIGIKSDSEIHQFDLECMIMLGTIFCPTFPGDLCSVSDRSAVSVWPCQDMQIGQQSGHHHRRRDHRPSLRLPRRPRRHRRRARLPRPTDSCIPLSPRQVLPLRRQSRTRRGSSRHLHHRPLRPPGHHVRQRRSHWPYGSPPRPRHRRLRSRVRRQPPRRRALNETCR